MASIRFPWPVGRWLVWACLLSCARAPERQPSSAPRLDDPRAAALAQAIEQGQVGSAKSLLAALGSALGAEAALSAARLALLAGDAVLALREIEVAKNQWPADPRCFATAAEVFAALGRLDAAQTEYDAGVATCGRTPELMRAQGVIGLSTPGQVELGLRLIEAAQAADPGLPYCSVALTRARAVLARLALGAGEPERARAWLAAGLSAAPDDPELRTIAAQIDLSEQRFAEARAAFEALYREGQPVREDYLTALRADAAAALLTRERSRQVTAYLRMLELGVPLEQLGFGADVLRQEAEQRIAEGISAYALGERLLVDNELDPAVRDEAVAARVRQFEKAESLFRAALDFDPDSLEARHRLGEALFRMGDFESAAREWEALALLSRGELDGESGLHLNIARAWRGAGHADRAQRVLEDYLAEYPRGEFVDQTERLLAQLTAPAAR
jgi:tetratricopeptide (TPR) repeat protein